MTVQTGSPSAPPAPEPTRPPAPEPSAVGTFDLEDSLPRVPLPSLEDSCARFLAWCAPLLTPAELAETEAAVERFRAPDGPGPALHAALVRYEASEGVHSWLDEFWLDRYLGRRDRIALNANYFFLFPGVPEPAPNTPDTPGAQAQRAAELVAAALDFKIRLDAERVPPERRRGQAQSMVRHRYLFSTTRIPGIPRDTVRAPYTEQWPGPSDARHIVVFRAGRPFRLDVLGPDGTPRTIEELAAGLAAVIAQADPTPLPLSEQASQLTTLARPAWAERRAYLRAHDPANAAALEDIERALLCVCLDEATPADSLETCDRLLHGGPTGGPTGGSGMNGAGGTAARWYDKAVTFVVFADGQAGINIEHCELDGATVLGFLDELFSAPAADLSARSGARSHGPVTPEPITFVLDDALRADVRAAAESFAAFGADSDSLTLSFPGHGANRAKSLKISPDALTQLAYQLAHHRAKGLVGATYESIATRGWHWGRTEAMRVVTPEVLAFVAAMEDPAADAGARRAALRAAAAAHGARAGECQRGEAPEQHLWELEFVQRRHGDALGVPDPSPLYGTPGWRISREDYLSTSSAPSTKVEFFGFGSTSGRCIGVAYVLLPDRLNIYLSTPGPVAAGMHAFAESLGEALAELDALLAAD
jgi:carnitine O-acetyltransferase